MQTKKRILLTLLVSLGVLASPGLINHIHVDMAAARPVQNTPSKKIASKFDHSKKTGRLSNAKNKDYLVKSKLKSHLKLSKFKNRSRSLRKSIRGRINNSLSTNSDHKDDNHQQISGMNRFAKRRAHFYYPQVSFNTRDLGGYETANGNYQVKPDRIIRSAKLQGISSHGIKALKKLGVRQDIDLRFPDQIEKRPDPGEPDSSRLGPTEINIQDDPVYSAQGDAMMRHGIHADGEWYFYGHSAVDSHDAIKAYQRIFHNLLVNRHGAILYHCDVGRDRTGVVSALILSALGVKRNTIYHDYLLTNYYRRKNDMHTTSYSRQAGELKHLFDTIDHQDGSVSHYLRKVIGLKHSDIKQLRSMYLEPVDD